MEGLMVLGAYALYAWLSVWVIKKAARSARARGISGWKWGLPAGLVMYHLLLWDLLPTVIAHRYYCHKDAGFVVHKTLEQWKLENPGVAENLTAASSPESWGSGDRMGFPINKRFLWESTSIPVFLSVRRNSDELIDITTKEIVSKKIDYSAGPRAWGYTVDDYRTMFFRKEHCVPPVEGAGKFQKYKDAVQTLGTTREGTPRE